jgi:paraquat-inducible protein A
VLYGAVIALQFMGIEIFGRSNDATLISFPAELTDSGFWPLAVLFLLFIIVLPPLKLLLLASVLSGLRLRQPPAILRTLFRCYGLIGPWAMIEVFLVGVFVAYTRLIGLATVDIGAAAWGLGGLMAAMTAADATLDPDAVWEAIDHRCRPHRHGAPALIPPNPSPGGRSPGGPPPGNRVTGCPRCGKVVALRAGIPGHPVRCPRCAARVWARKPASLSRTWALLLAACICAIGAYAYPVMTVTRLGQGAPMTIIEGIIELFAIGWWPIGIIVFVASLTIPLFKLIALATMLIGTQRGSPRGLRTRTRIYRFVEAIGRWSMIDIFMVSILTVLVRFGFLGTVHPNRGAVAFAAVVILTMLAAYSFDPRLMWDAAAQPVPDDT